MNTSHHSDAPHHPVLTAPWTYKVVALTLRCADQMEETLELSLQKDGELVLLRFVGVAELEIEAGFPWSSSGLQILDTSARGTEQAHVHVSSFEQNPAIRFGARSVERVVA